MAMNYGVVILGAGASKRMGKPKLTLPWRGSTVIDGIAQQWRELDATQLVIVASNDNDELRVALDDIGFAESHRIFNPDPERGMFSSIRCAAQWSGWERGLTHVAIVPGDMPCIQQSTLRALLSAGTEHPNTICQPGLGCRPAHPVLLPVLDFDALQSTTHPTLKHFLKEREERRQLVEVRDPGVALDIDTPALYREALRISGQESRSCLSDSD